MTISVFSGLAGTKACNESQNNMVMRSNQVSKANRWTNFCTGTVIKGKWNENNFMLRHDMASRLSAYRSPLQSLLESQKLDWGWLHATIHVHPIQSSDEYRTIIRPCFGTDVGRTASSCNWWSSLTVPVSSIAVSLVSIKGSPFLIRIFVGFGNLIYSQVAYAGSVYHNFVVLCSVKLNYKDEQESSREKGRVDGYVCDREADSRLYPSVWPSGENRKYLPAGWW